MTEERPLTTIYDCSTGIEETRPMTDEEWDFHKKVVAEAQKEMALRNAEKEAQDALRLSARAKLIAGEPLTEEEAAVIVL